MRIARIAHADMAERVEHAETRQRPIGGDEIVDQLAINRIGRRLAPLYRRAR